VFNEATHLKKNPDDFLTIIPKVWILERLEIYPLGFHTEKLTLNSHRG